MTWLFALLRVPFQVHAINESQIKEIAYSLQSEYPDWKDEKAKAVARRMRSERMFKTPTHIDFNAMFSIDESDRPWFRRSIETFAAEYDAQILAERAALRERKVRFRREHPLVYSITVVLGIIGWGIVLAFAGLLLYAIFGH